MKIKQEYEHIDQRWRNAISCYPNVIDQRHAQTFLENDTIKTTVWNC